VGCVCGVLVAAVQALDPAGQYNNAAVQHKRAAAGGAGKLVKRTCSMQATCVCCQQVHSLTGCSTMQVQLPRPRPASVALCMCCIAHKTSCRPPRASQHVNANSNATSVVVEPFAHLSWSLGTMDIMLVMSCSRKHVLVSSEVHACFVQC
jgi:hypothetical protein